MTPLEKKGCQMPEKANRKKLAQPTKPLESNRLGYSMRELAQLWGCSERSIWALVASGKLDHFKIGRLVRIPREAADAFMANGGGS
jgi:excisionase family DNA binding protein